MVDEFRRYVCDKCKHHYETHGEAQHCEGHHTLPSDMNIIKVDNSYETEHIRGFPQAITTTLKKPDRTIRAVYVLRHVEHDYIEERSMCGDGYGRNCIQWHSRSKYGDAQLSEKMNGMLD